MMATSAAPVAAAFSSSSRPVSFGLSVCAAIPEPITAIKSKAVPTNSASARRINWAPESRGAAPSARSATWFAAIARVIPLEWSMADSNRA